MIRIHRNPVNQFATAVAIAFLLVQPGLALAEDGEVEPGRGSISGDVSGLSDAEIEQRTRFIEERLDEGQLHSQVWQYGFTAGYGLGVVIGVAGLAGYSNNDQRVTSGVTAGKAVIGVGRLLWSPHPGRHGGEPIREVQGNTREDKLRRLAVAENLLDENAARARSRWAWQRHAANVGINLVGFGFEYGFAEEGSALINLGIGITVGTIMAFSMPWRAEDDLADYQQKFEGVEQSRISWSIAPLATEEHQGVAFGLRF